MTISITKSHDNAGIFAESTTQGSALRQAVIQHNRLVTDVQNILTFLRNSTQQNPGFAISSNFDVKNANAVTVAVAGVLKTLGANTNFDTGTAANIAADKWGIALLTWDGTTGTVTWALASTAMSYATEAAAIAALGTTTRLIPADGFASLGYVTVETGSAATWTAGTDALTTGTGGNPATATNYYNDPTLNGTFGTPASPTAYQIGNEVGTAITQ